MIPTKPLIQESESVDENECARKPSAMTLGSAILDSLKGIPTITLASDVPDICNKNQSQMAHLLKRPLKLALVQLATGPPPATPSPLKII